jgi:hypothetical protein
MVSLLIFLETVPKLNDSSLDEMRGTGKMLKTKRQQNKPRLGE